MVRVWRLGIARFRFLGLGEGVSMAGRLKGMPGGGGKSGGGCGLWAARPAAMALPVDGGDPWWVVLAAGASDVSG